MKVTVELHHNVKKIYDVMIYLFNNNVPMSICLIKPTYTLVNCSSSAYCCDSGCCSHLWYTGPLAIFLILVSICCMACVKACWDAYREEIAARSNYRVVRVGYRNTGSNNSQVVLSPPPSYNVAIFLPQPRASNRIPSYEEVMAERQNFVFRD